MQQAEMAGYGMAGWQAGLMGAWLSCDCSAWPLLALLAAWRLEFTQASPSHSCFEGHSQHSGWSVGT